MTNMIHTAHNNSDDSRHTWRACLALKAELHIGLHQGELTEACSGIDHSKAGDSVVRTRKPRPRRTRETELTEKLALKKDVSFLQVSFQRNYQAQPQVHMHQYKKSPMIVQSRVQDSNVYCS